MADMVENEESVNGRAGRGEDRGREEEERAGAKRLPIHEAVLSRNVTALKWLLHHGAFPNRINDDGDSELHLCVYVGDLEIFETLVLFGSDVTLLNAKEESCLDVAKRSHTFLSFDFLSFALSFPLPQTSERGLSLL